MEEIIKNLRELPELDLPNGATGAVWLEDVINVVKNYFNDDTVWFNEDNDDNEYPNKFNF